MPVSFQDFLKGTPARQTMPHQDPRLMGSNAALYRRLDQIQGRPGQPNFSMSFNVQPGEAQLPTQRPGLQRPSYAPQPIFPSQQPGGPPQHPYQPMPIFPGQQQPPQLTMPGTGWHRRWGGGQLRARIGRPGMGSMQKQPPLFQPPAPTGNPYLPSVSYY